MSTDSFFTYKIQYDPINDKNVSINDWWDTSECKKPPSRLERSVSDLK